MFDLNESQKQMSVDNILNKTEKLNKEKKDQELWKHIKAQTFNENVKELKQYLGGEVQFWLFVVFFFTIGLPLMLEFACLYIAFKFLSWLLIPF